MKRDLENVYWTHRQGLYTLALAITRCPSLAEDAVQDAFTRLWRSNVRPRSQLVPYVFAAVRNAALDQARARHREAPLPASIYNGRPGPSDNPALDADDQRRLRDAVDRLPDRERETLVLKVYADLTFEQVADVLDEPLGTVAARYRRALDRLCERMHTLP